MDKRTHNINEALNHLASMTTSEEKFQIHRDIVNALLDARNCLTAVGSDDDVDLLRAIGAIDTYLPAVAHRNWVTTDELRTELKSIREVLLPMVPVPKSAALV